MEDDAHTDAFCQAVDCFERVAVPASNQNALYDKPVGLGRAAWNRPTNTSSC